MIIHVYKKVWGRLAEFIISHENEIISSHCDQIISFHRIFKNGGWGGEGGHLSPLWIRR